MKNNKNSKRYSLVLSQGRPVAILDSDWGATLPVGYLSQKQIADKIYRLNKEADKASTLADVSASVLYAAVGAALLVVAMISIEIIVLLCA